MTVIAWDGKTLAADKQMTSSGLRRTTRKLFRIGDRLVAVSGDSDVGLEVVEWLKNGAAPKEFPESARNDDGPARVLVVSKDGVSTYERGPFPIPCEDKHFAMGSGRDFALAAMYLGKSARQAVEVACVFDSGCGMGIDTLRLK